MTVFLEAFEFPGKKEFSKEKVCSLQEVEEELDKQQLFSASLK